MRSARLSQAVLYGIVDLGYVVAEAVPEVTRAMLKRGIKVIQLRAKNVDYSLVLQMAKVIRAEIEKGEALFIVNDYPEIAVEVGADGVHVGQDDGAYDWIRKKVGGDLLIGRSTHSIEQARKAYEDGFDYIGFGPLYATATKPGRPAIGLNDVSRLSVELGGDFPAFCIGGVNLERLELIKKAGATRYVIVSELLNNIGKDEYWSGLGETSR